jgi:hypothetical protein
VAADQSREAPAAPRRPPRNAASQPATHPALSNQSAGPDTCQTVRCPAASRCSVAVRAPAAWSTVTPVNGRSGSPSTVTSGASAVRPSSASAAEARGRDRDDPGHPLVQVPLDHSTDRLPVQAGDAAHAHREPGRTRRLLEGGEQRAGPVQRGVQRDEPRSWFRPVTGARAARRAVPELGDRGVAPPSRLDADVRVVVEHPRDGLVRQTGEPGHVHIAGSRVLLVVTRQLLGLGGGAAPHAGATSSRAPGARARRGWYGDGRSGQSSKRRRRHPAALDGITVNLSKPTVENGRGAWSDPGTDRSIEGLTSPSVHVNNWAVAREAPRGNQEGSNPLHPPTAAVSRPWCAHRDGARHRFPLGGRPCRRGHPSPPGLWPPPRPHCSRSALPPCGSSGQGGRRLAHAAVGGQHPRRRALSNCRAPRVRPRRSTARLRRGRRRRPQPADRGVADR